MPAETEEAVPPPEITHLTPFELHGRGAVKKHLETREIISMEGFFARLAALDDAEDAPTWGHARDAGDALPPRPARLLRSVEGFCVFLPEDEEVPVLIVGETKALQRPVAELRPGQRVVLMPGSDRSSMLAELFDSFDQRLGPAYPLLYARALSEAWKNAGGSDRALAARVGVEEATVATWRRGEHRPQQDHVLYEVLKLSEIQPAWTQRTNIREYLSTVRGHHRQIAKIFDEAVVETVVELGDQARAQLEPLGLDLDAFFNSVQVVTVASVSDTSRDVPGSAIGQFLTADHPLLKIAA
jgi:DNA-binding transcriptional regulator YiaG